MNTPFQFRFLRTGLKSFSELEALIPMFGPFLDAAFRKNVFEAIEKQMSLDLSDRQISYTLEILIGDDDPLKDGISVHGDVNGKNVNASRYAIPKWLDQMNLTQKDRNKFSVAHYSPAARDQHRIYLLKALGLFVERWVNPNHPKYQDWPEKVNLFFKVLEDAVPDFHHRIYNTIEGAPRTCGLHIPVIDVEHLREYSPIYHALDALIKQYLSDQCEAAVYSDIDRQPGRLNDNENILRITESILPSYPITSGARRNATLNAITNDIVKPRDLVLDNERFAQYTSIVVPMIADLIRVKDPNYRDITTEVFPDLPPKTQPSNTSKDIA